MLQDGAVASSHFERIEGAVRPILDRYGIRDGDVLVVVSNSGVNAAPIEAARYAREKGAAIIALTSVAYSNTIARGRTQLLSLADVVLDNDAPSGDAVLEIAGSALKVGPVSTALGVTILNAVFADVAARLGGRGGRAHLSQRQYAGIGRYQPFAGGALPRPQSASLKNLGDLSSDRA